MSDWGYFGYMIPVRGTWKNESYSRHPETRDLAMGACECQGAPGKLLPPSRYLLSHAQLTPALGDTWVTLRPQGDPG